MPSVVNELYEFGSFQLDPGERLLLCEGRPVPLTPKAFDMLVVLVARSGHLVEKEELMKAIWPDSFVEEGNLCVTVSLLRKALTVHQDGNTYIETVSKRGYRFVADVKQTRPNGPSPLTIDHLEAPAVIYPGDAQILLRSTVEVTPATIAKIRRRILLALASVAVVVGTFFFSRMVTTRGVTSPGAEATAVKSLAVLPFQNLGTRDEYIGLAIADALTTRLGNTGKIVMRPTSAIEKYANAPQDPQAVGREQGVDAVLGGRIQREGDRVRVTVQLIRVRDGVQIWADTFDDKATNIFAMEDAVSTQVARSIGLQLNGEEKKRFAKRPTDNSEAYEAYIRGRYFWDKRTDEGMKKGLAYFREAIALDPTFSQAYVGIADSYATLGLYAVLPPREAFPAAKEASKKALEMDPNLAEAHATLGFIAFYYDWDGRAVESEFRQAFDKNPNYAIGHSWNGEALAAMGRFPEAIHEAKLAQENDPLSMSINTNAGWTLFLAGHHGEAMAALKKIIEIDPSFPRAHFRLGSAYADRGMYGEAIAELQKAVQFSAGDPYYEGALGHAYAVSGNVGAARRMLALLKSSSKRRYIPAYAIALIYAGLGEKDNAFIWLGKACEDRSTSLAYVKVDPILNSLRSDPRFVGLVQRIAF
jgi:DNA-binding winged helix-turn-helix (wHTH) protein/TolB-like protein/tetratricopeptide (TPR) repeat protein